VDRSSDTGSGSENLKDVELCKDQGVRLIGMKRRFLGYLVQLRTRHGSGDRLATMWCGPEACGSIL